MDYNNRNRNKDIGSWTPHSLNVYRIIDYYLKVNPKYGLRLYKEFGKYDPKIKRIIKKYCEVNREFKEELDKYLKPELHPNIANLAKRTRMTVGILGMKYASYTKGRKYIGRKYYCKRCNFPPSTKLEVINHIVQHQQNH